MNDTGHYRCSSRPRTLAEQNELATAAGVLFAKAATALDDMQRDLRGAVVKSRLTPAYDELAGLSRAVTVGEGKPERPKPEWCRGKCPACGDDLVSNCYRVDGGFLIYWECWGSLAAAPTCNYREVL